MLGKVFPYHEATNVPMYMRWPAELGKKRRLDTRLVANVDFAPTFYDVAGIDPGYEVDGRSLFDPGNDRDFLLTESVKWKAVQDKHGSLIETKTDNPRRARSSSTTTGTSTRARWTASRASTRRARSSGSREMSAVLDASGTAPARPAPWQAGCLS